MHVKNYPNIVVAWIMQLTDLELIGLAMQKTDEEDHVVSAARTELKCRAEIRLQRGDIIPVVSSLLEMSLPEIIAENIRELDMLLPTGNVSQSCNACGPETLCAVCQSTQPRDPQDPYYHMWRM